LESPWVNVMAALAPPFPSPESSASGATWRKFTAECVGFASVPAVLGLIVAASVLVRSCMRKPARSGSAPPRAKALRYVSRIAVLLALGGAFALLSVGRHGIHMASEKVGEAADDARSVADLGTTLSLSAKHAAHTVDVMTANCTDTDVQKQLQGLQGVLASVANRSKSFETSAARLPHHLDSARSTVDKVKGLAILGLALPSIVSLLCCLLVAYLVRMTQKNRSSSGCCNSCIVRTMGMFIFAPTILIIALATSCEYFLASATGSFCKGVDTNVLTYTHHFARGFTYNVTSFYITGKGNNPLLADVRDANSSLADALDLVAGIPIGTCLDQGVKTGVNQQLSKAVDTIGAVERIASPAHIYPYYTTVVHEEVCATFVSSVGWLMLSQFVLGIVCLPVLACMADAFFEHHAAARSRARDACATERLTGV